MENVHFFKNMEGKDFLNLLHSSICLIGNSSVGIRECSYLGVPTVNIGSRQNRRDRGRNVVDVPHDTASIQAAIEYMWSQKARLQDTVYGNGRAGVNIANVLAKVPLTIEKTLTY
jgi:UDP-N-acetylglucosamine 2-epimerase